MAKVYLGEFSEHLNHCFIPGIETPRGSPSWVSFLEVKSATAENRRKRSRNKVRQRARKSRTKSHSQDKTHPYIPAAAASAFPGTAVQEERELPVAFAIAFGPTSGNGARNCKWTPRYRRWLRGWNAVRLSFKLYCAGSSVGNSGAKEQILGGKGTSSPTFSFQPVKLCPYGGIERPQIFAAPLFPRPSRLKKSAFLSERPSL